MAKDLEKKLKQFRNKPLHSKEWSDSLERKIILYTKDNPIPDSVTKELKSSRQRQRVTDGSSFLEQPTFRGMFYQLRLSSLGMKMTLALGLILALVGGVGAAAEAAVPSEPLYSWKVNVNERARSAITVGAQNQAEYEVKLMQKRLGELAKVSVQAEVDAQAQTEATVRFGAQQDKVQARIESLENESNTRVALEINSRAAATLEANAELLSGLRLRIPPVANRGLETAIDSIVSARDRIEARASGLEARFRSEVQARGEAMLVVEARERVQAGESRVNMATRIADEAATQNALTIEIRGQLRDAQNALIRAQEALERENHFQAITEAQVAVEAALEIESKIKADDKRNALKFSINDNSGASVVTSFTLMPQSPINSISPRMAIDDETGNQP